MTSSHDARPVDSLTEGSLVDGDHSSNAHHQQIDDTSHLEE